MFEVLQEALELWLLLGSNRASTILVVHEQLVIAGLGTGALGRGLPDVDFLDFGQIVGVHQRFDVVLREIEVLDGVLARLLGFSHLRVHF